MSTEMDYLVVGDFVYTKHEQIDANNLEKWRTNFKKD
jgi:carbamoyltransferase